jgi:hypothetical protein
MGEMRVVVSGVSGMVAEGGKADGGAGGRDTGRGERGEGGGGSHADP